MRLAVFCFTMLLSSMPFAHPRRCESVGNQTLCEGDFAHFYDRGDDYVGTVVDISPDAEIRLHFASTIAHIPYLGQVTLDSSKISPEVRCFDHVCSGKSVHFTSIHGEKKGKVRNVFSNGRVLVDYEHRGQWLKAWVSLSQASDEIIGAGGFMAQDCVEFKDAQANQVGTVVSVFRNSMAEVRPVVGASVDVYFVPTYKLTYSARERCK